jgi:hypothetical protein
LKPSQLKGPKFLVALFFCPRFARHSHVNWTSVFTTL